MPFVEGLGAEKVVDVDVDRFDAVERAYDVVLDTVGGSTLERSYAVLRPGGRLVTLQAPPPAELAAQHEVTGIFFIVSPDRKQLIHLAHLVDGEGLRVTLAATFPLAQGRAAYESGAGPGRRPGKTVLEVS